MLFVPFTVPSFPATHQQQTSHPVPAHQSHHQQLQPPAGAQNQVVQQQQQQPPQLSQLNHLNHQGGLVQPPTSNQPTIHSTSCSPQQQATTPNKVSLDCVMNLQRLQSGRYSEYLFFKESLTKTDVYYFILRSYTVLYLNTQTRSVFSRLKIFKFNIYIYESAEYKKRLHARKRSLPYTAKTFSPSRSNFILEKAAGVSLTRICIAPHANLFKHRAKFLHLSLSRNNIIPIHSHTY